MTRFLGAALAFLIIAPTSSLADDACPAGMELKEGVGCVPRIEKSCPAGTLFEEGRGCVARVIECPPGAVLEANKCVARPTPKPPADKPAAPEATKKPHVDGADRSPRRLWIGLRVGFAAPLLNAYREAHDGSAVALSDRLHGALPIGLEVGVRVIERLYIGAYVSYGPAFVRRASDGYCSQSATTCNGDQLRVGLNARYYLSEGALIEPWLGVGAGYERLGLRYEGVLATGDTGGVRTTLSGIELVELSGGGDLRPSGELRVGPFLAFALGRYGSVALDETIGDRKGGDRGGIRNPTVHAFVTLGVRGTFAPF